MAYWVIIIKSMQEFFREAAFQKGVLIHDGGWCGRLGLYLERKREEGVREKKIHPPGAPLRVGRMLSGGPLPMTFFSQRAAAHVL